MRFAGKVAVVTGATLGIGRATAELLAQDGASVVVHGRSEERAAEVVDAIASQGGTAAQFLGDVADESVIQELIAFARSRFGHIDILVNNARTNVSGSVTELTAADWDDSLNVMLRAPFLACKYALPDMVARGAGAIINVSSVHGFFGYPHHPAYEAAKAALNNLTRQLAVEYGPHGIRANSVCPGGVFIRERDEPISIEEERRRAFLYPLRRHGQPGEVAQAIAFLASDHASFITGQALVVDGGLTSQLPDFAYVERNYQPGVS